MRILILGITGMLGCAVFKQLSIDQRYQVWGTLRNLEGKRHFSEHTHSRLLNNVDVLDQDTLIKVLERVRPEVIINCIGLIKQLADANDPLSALPINAILPHRLANLCELTGTRLIHVSTDCVFSGIKGRYTEADDSDAKDLYGKSKFIGELNETPHAITLRTSIIGHELGTNLSLLDWFLSQEGPVKGYRKAIFSGLPTVELARVIQDYVIPAPELNGLYHVSAEPIDKLSLLRLVAKVYERNVKIIPDEQVCIDRSLDSTQFRQATGYIPPSWPELIRKMHDQR